MRFSLVIPTCNRVHSLERTLLAIDSQQYPHDSFEVIVADDGSVDGTAEMLQRLRPGFRLHVLSFAASNGPAAARNLAAGVATGRIILFLDDDVEASPRLLLSHDEGHQHGATVTIGPLDTAPSRATGFFNPALRGWWDAMFAEMRRPGHRFGFRDVLTPNCAVDANLFRKVGGFDVALRVHEDYELGVRLVNAGAELRMVEGARAVHHECSTIARSFDRKMGEGKADVQMLRRHPQLVSQVPLGVFSEHSGRKQRAMRRLVFGRPAIANAIAAAWMRWLNVLEAARMRGRWHVTLYDLFSYWYWRGVADEVGTFDDFKQLLSTCRKTRTRYRRLSIDLGGGRFDQAMKAIDSQRPDGVFITYLGVPVGEIAPQPGFEPLRGVHLKASLARDLSHSLMLAVAKAGVFDIGTRDRNLVADSLPTEALSL